MIPRFVMNRPPPADLFKLFQRRKDLLDPADALARGSKRVRVRRNLIPKSKPWGPCRRPRRSGRREYFFDTSYYPIYKSDFNSSAVCRRAGQDVPDDPLGQLAGTLVLLLNDAHTRSRFYAGTGAVVKDPQTIWGPSYRPRAGLQLDPFSAVHPLPLHHTRSRFYPRTSAVEPDPQAKPWGPCHCA